MPPKKSARAASKAPASRANIARKHGATDDDDEALQAPAVKKMKSNSFKAVPTKTSTSSSTAFRSTAIKKVAPKKIATTTAARKTATKKPAAPKKGASKAAPQPKKAAPKSAAAKRKASDDDEDEDDDDEDDDDQDEDPVTKKTKTSHSKAASKKKPSILRKAVSKPKKASAPTKTSLTKAAAPQPKKATAPKKAAAKMVVAPKKVAAPKQVVDPISKVKIGPAINTAPTTVLDIYVFGEGSAGELGLGHRRIDGKVVIDVKRPRLNPKLSAADVGVVQISCGGMHVIALTKDNKVLTWGVNDQGALGRDTKWDDSQANDSDDDDDSGLNPLESAPTEINMDNVAPGTKFVEVAAADSASFALTDNGRVYSWGTFRSGDGILGFSTDVVVQNYPVLLDEPKKVVSLATGSNHVLTLDNKGKVQAWGAPEQNQLGRRVVVRGMKAAALRPGGVSIKRGVKITKVRAGAYHSFAIDGDGRVWAWGLNNYGQLGTGTDDIEVGEDGVALLEPTRIDALAGHRVVEVVGGEHHTLAITNDGRVFSFGRIDGAQLGFVKAYYDRENSIFGERNDPRVLRAPTLLEGLPPVASGDAGTDTNLVVTSEGRAYSWGFNENYQTGLGPTKTAVETPTLLNNDIFKVKKIIYAGCGGQFGMVGCAHEDEEKK